MMKDWVTVQEAAEALGISVSTFKRSCEGLGIPIVRTPGGHRRIDRAAIAIAQKSLLRPGKDEFSQEPFDLRRFSEQLSSCLHEMQVSRAVDLLLSSARSVGSMATLFDLGVAPFFWSAGCQVANGELPIYQERVLVQSILQALNSLFEVYRRDRDDPVKAIGATFPPSMDTIGSCMIHLSLLEFGIRSIDLGPCVPVDTLAEAVHRWKVEVVWINHTHVIDPQQVIADHEKLHQLLPSGVRVVVGGGGLSPSVRRQLTQCVYYETIQSMISEQFPNSTPMQVSSLMPAARGA